MSLRSVAGKSITVQTAEIKSATVEIKTLTVSNKQVTLATFRQIPQERLIDGRTITLRGVVWGRVNYFWDAVDTAPCYFFESSPNFYKNGDYANKGFPVHVLWQLGTELRRDVVYYQANVIAKAFEKLQLEVLVWSQQPAVKGQTLIGDLHDDELPYLLFNREAFLQVVEMELEEAFSRPPPKQVYRVHNPGPKKPSYQKPEDYANDLRQYADYRIRRKQYGKELKDWALDASATLTAIAANHYRDYLDRLRRHNALIDAIQQTDQLFIAV